MKKTVAAVLAAVLTLFTACGGGGENGEVYVYCYGDYFDEENSSVSSPNHVYCEAYVDGRWVIMDPTWDATPDRLREKGKLLKGKLGPLNYFDITEEMLAWSHKITYRVDSDDEDIPNAAARLRQRFGRVLALDFDNARTRAAGSPEIDAALESDDRSPMELMEELYYLTHRNHMSDEARAFVTERFGTSYVPSKPNVYASGKNAQDA